MVEIDTLLAEHHRVLRAVCDQHRREILVHVCFGAGCLSLLKMLGDVIAHQHALRAVRFLMVQRYRIAVRQCHINSSVQIDNTAYLAAFLIDRLVKFSALCGHASNGRNLSAGRISHQEHLRWIQLVFLRMRTQKTYRIFRIDDLCREMRDAAVTVFHDGNNVAALCEAGDHADFLIDILFHPGRSLNKCDARPGALRVRHLEWCENFQMKIVRLVVDNFMRIADLHFLSGHWNFHGAVHRVRVVRHCLIRVV